VLVLYADASGATSSMYAGKLYATVIG
jgi:hypothetical protein